MLVTIAINMVVYSHTLSFTGLTAALTLSSQMFSKNNLVMWSHVHDVDFY